MTRLSAGWVEAPCDGMGVPGRCAPAVGGKAALRSEQALETRVHVRRPPADGRSADPRGGARRGGPGAHRLGQGCTSDGRGRRLDPVDRLEREVEDRERAGGAVAPHASDEDAPLTHEPRRELCIERHGPAMPPRPKQRKKWRFGLDAPVRGEAASSTGSASSRGRTTRDRSSSWCRPPARAAWS